MCDHLPKVTVNPKDQSFPVKALQFEPLVTDHFLSQRVNDFPLFIDHLMHSLISMFTVCTMLTRMYDMYKELY